MSANGRLRNSELSSIGGGYYLRHDAARAFNAMSADARKRWGRPIQVVSAYRTYQRQVELRRLYGPSRAAVPGRSNHGTGIAVDLVLPWSRWAVDQIGARYGYAKRCSDASWEAWHVIYNPRCTGATYKPALKVIQGGKKDRVLRQGMKGRDVREVQTYLLRGGYLRKGNKAKRIPPAIDGHFGPNTKRAVQRFQKDSRLAADGIVGPATIKALRAKYRRKKK